MNKLDTFKVRVLVLNTLVVYDAADVTTKCALIAIIEDQLAKHRHGLKHIGMGLADTHVRAAALFLRLINLYKI